MGIGVKHELNKWKELSTTLDKGVQLLYFVKHHLMAYVGWE
jgi:hypothetical protein